MKIALDCRSVFQGHGGIGSYTKKLAKGITEADKEFDYILLTTSRLKENLTKHKNVVQASYEAGMIDQRWEQLQLPDILTENDVDLYHNTCFSLPVIKTVKSRVTTIHDVVFRARPELVDDGLRRYLDLWTEHAVASADAIITVSEYSKQEIIKYYNADAEKIHVIYNGIGSEFKKASEAKKRALRKKYGFPDEFILYLGSIEPKKNIDLLLDAFKIFLSRSQKACPLVLAGGQGGKRYDLDSAVKTRGLTEKVVKLGYVDKKDIVSLLSSATVFVYPSQYEGFGLPPLEAMACGTATVVSNASCLPEVVGDAALIADVSDAEDLTQKIEMLFADEDLRKSFEKKGAERAKKFTWKQASEETLNIYRDLLKCQ
jgi:glycosyltransferase involved in cell wall biosynthesis